MGNECCRVKSYIDEDEELRHPSEQWIVSNVKKQPNIEPIPEDSCLPEIISENLSTSKEYGGGECIIVATIEDSLLELSDYASITTEEATNPSYDIVSQTSIQSFE